MRKACSIVLLSAAVLTLLGCGHRKFRGPEGARQYLTAHRAQLQSAADEWLTRKGRDTFCRFSDGDYRWNDVFFRRQADGTYVISDAAEMNKRWQLPAVLARAQVDSKEFAYWDSKLRSLDGYCIQTYPVMYSDTVLGKYAVILLQGEPSFSWSGYGYAFAPPKSKAWEDIVWYARSEDHEYGAKTWVYDIGDGWFYYVDQAR